MKARRIKKQNAPQGHDAVPGVVHHRASRTNSVRAKAKLINLTREAIRQLVVCPSPRDNCAYCIYIYCIYILYTQYRQYIMIYYVCMCIPIYSNHAKRALQLLVQLPGPPEISSESCPSLSMFPISSHHIACHIACHMFILFILATLCHCTDFSEPSPARAPMSFPHTCKGQWTKVDETNLRGLPALGCAGYHGASEVLLGLGHVVSDGRTKVPDRNGGAGHKRFLRHLR